MVLSLQPLPSPAEPSYLNLLVSYTTPYIQHLIYNTSHTIPCIQHIIYNTTYTTPYIQQLIYNTLYITPHIQHLIYNTLYTTPHIQYFIYNTLYITPYIKHLIYNTSYINFSVSLPLNLKLGYKEILTEAKVRIEQNKITTQLCEQFFTACKVC